MHGETFDIHRSSNSDGFDPLAISQLYLSLEICAKWQAHCSLSPDGAAWKSTSHSLFHFVACSASWFHAGRTANIEVDHSLDWPGHSKSWFLAVSGIHSSPVVQSLPWLWALHVPIPMRNSWCATLIWRKSKEGYRAPWLSKECIFFREDSGKSIAIGISLPWYAQDSRGGCDSKFPFLSLFPKQKQTFDKFWIVNFSFTISIRNSHLKISKL